MKITTYSVKGTRLADTTLPKELEMKVNMNLLSQALRVYEERGHTGLRNTQTRAEVNRTGKKLYKQKGTGGARHGSRRANVFVGGGVALGPRPLRRILTLPGKIKRKARAMAFSSKASEKELLAVNGLGKIGKTKEASEFIKKIARELGKTRFTFVLSEANLGTNRFLRNLATTKAVSYKNANAFDIYNGGVVVLDTEIFEAKKISKEEKISKVSKAQKKGSKGL